MATGGTRLPLLERASATYSGRERVRTIIIVPLSPPRTRATVIRRGARACSRSARFGTKGRGKRPRSVVLRDGGFRRVTSLPSKRDVRDRWRLHSALGRRHCGRMNSPAPWCQFSKVRRGGKAERPRSATGHVEWQVCGTSRCSKPAARQVEPGSTRCPRGRLLNVAVRLLW